MRRIIRVRKATNYVVMDKTHLNDRELSWKGTGLMCYLLGLPDDWQVNVVDLMTRKKDGRDGTYAAMHELIKQGYVTKSILKDDKGRVQGVEYIVYEGGKERSEVELFAEESPALSPLPGFPDLEKPEQLSNDITNKDKESPKDSTSGKGGSGKRKKVTTQEFKTILKWFYDNNPNYGRIHNGAQAAMIKQIERKGNMNEINAWLSSFLELKGQKGSKFWDSLPVTPRGFLAAFETIIGGAAAKKIATREDTKKLLGG